MNDIEKYWKAVSPVTDREFRTACAYIREKWPDAVLSRRRAQTLGIPIYRMQKPCKHGHRSWRYVTSQACIGCMRSRTDGLLKHKRLKMRQIDRVTRDVMRDAPNLVITAHDAQAAGLAAYRLGEPCGLCGETSWRHIDTLACVNCMPGYAPAPPGQDLVFEESFAALRDTIHTFDLEQLKGIERNIKKQCKKEPRHAPDLNRALRFVRRHIREYS